tara:strand:+ start:634 stop:816 length:183 start_codon:yes stop_codon:yes gene_type:complete
MNQALYLEQKKKFINMLLLKNDYKSAFFCLIKIFENSEIKLYEEFQKEIMEIINKIDLKK